MDRRAFLALAVAIPVIGTIARPALARSPQTFSVAGVAIRGTDPVAYFTEGRVVAGDPAFAFDHAEATWHFASAANRDAFAADPTRYAPQFGGYCAFATSRGYIASTDPQAWTIWEGKLYLNYSLDVRTLWSADIPGNIALGNKNWPGVLDA